MIPLAVCRWRTEIDAETCRCSSARFVNPPNKVPLDFCARCPIVDHEPPTLLPPARPCLHLDSLPAGTVQRKVSLPLFACAVHGQCAHVGADIKLPRGVQSCGGCADYTARELNEPTSVQMRLRADQFQGNVPPYPARRYRGRGIVMAGGGERFFASLYVAIRALRHVGCTLPIEVWYLGRDDEMPAARQTLLAKYQVRCVDADQVRRRHPARNLGGWELKIFAALHSRFEELLFLDADCYPCRNPEFLFERRDYQECGAIFWPDVRAVDLRLKWSGFGVDNPGRAGSVESGQFVLSKRQCWKPLNLAWFYNDHSDYYYRHGYGDKHTLEVAWARCQQPFVMWRPEADWREVAYVHAGPEGEPLFVHRCADKFRFKPEAFATPQRKHGPGFYPQLPLERECWTWLGDLALALTLSDRCVRGTAALVPEKIVRIGLPGHYNCSIIRHQERLLLASRQDHGGPRLYLTELGADFQPLWTRPLEIDHPRAHSGSEDPRLFHYRGRLHCAFTGLEYSAPSQRIHQMICRLDAGHRPEKVWLPVYRDRTDMEKNWQFFEHHGGLYSIYAIRPHVVLRHRRGRAEIAARSETTLPWPEQHLRGGAPPVRVGDEFYHFFHAVKETRGQYDYALGVYTFSAQPPFAIRRIARDLILTADDYDRRPEFGKRVVFPCGAIYQPGAQALGRWMISYGYHDHECRLAVFRADTVEALLQEVDCL